VQVSTTHNWSAQLTRNKEEYSMSFRRAVASMLVPLAVFSISGSRIAAQVNNPANNQAANRGTSLLVPITGVADVGGLFNGTLLIDRFAQQANGVAAIGTVTGTLTEAGTVRNLVMQVTLPLDFDASRARLNTDAALAQASCDVLHVELAGASMNVLGSTIGLNPVAFDVTSTLQSTNAPAPVSPATSTAPAPTATTGTRSGTVTATPSANTTQPVVVGSSTPGAVTTPPQPATGTTPATQTALGSLLCSVDRFSDVSSPANVAQQLNAILTALGTTAGS
jgi:hypothetical protein